MEKEILEKISGICTSDELAKNKVDEIYEIVIKGLGKDKGIPDSQELLKLGKKIIKKENLSINKLKINKDGNFEFLVYFSDGCNGDWCDREILSPCLFHEKGIKPNLK